MKSMAIFLALFALTSSADEVYRCLNEQGQVTYQPEPCIERGNNTGIITHGNKPAGSGWDVSKSLKIMRQVRQSGRRAPTKATQRRRRGKVSRDQLSASCGRAFHSHTHGANIKGVEHLLQNRVASQHADRREIKELRCRLRYLR